MQAAGPDPWPGGCGCGSGDTMTTLTGHDLDAADLLALARLDDDGAPCPGVRPRPQPARPAPDTTPAAREPTDARPPPVVSPGTSGGRSPAAGSPGRHPPVTASRAELIAAAPGRGRHQLTPALLGVG